MAIRADITERKQAEERIGASLKEVTDLKAALDEHAIVAITDPRGKINYVNDKFCAISKYAREELLGQDHRIINSGYHSKAFIYELWATISRGRVWKGELRNRAKDGSVYWVDTTIVPFLNAEGKPYQYVAIRADVTERKQAEEALARQQQVEETLRTATQSAELANLAKSQFLANMSHEIRTPMHAVIGLTYLLGQTGLDAEQKTFLHKIKRASKSLLGVISDVLDLSKIEAGELTLERAPFSLLSVLQDLEHAMAVHAQVKRIGFELDLAADLPDVLFGDVTRLNQILTNLLFNAIKFTEHGAVRLVVRPLAQTPHSVRLCLTVVDTGIGIAPEAQARLFAPFAQADASTTRRFGGTGLGLSIVKRLIDLKGGEVGFKSSVGVGSEFWVVLEFARSSMEAGVLRTTQPVPVRGRGLVGVRVLVVDDSEINLEVAQRILELEGAQVALAANGYDAVERLRAHPFDFDVVLMDVQMPVLDGNEATRLIRSELGLKDLPIIALTAGALTSERQRSVAAGMDDFISKPFDVQTVVSCIRRHVQPRSSPAGAAVAGVAGVASVASRTPRPDRPLPASAAPPWPEIEGIDSSDARARLGGDLSLFRSMLRRLLNEFSEDSTPSDRAAGDALTTPAGRMHKLRGSAGMLGAKAISELAGEVEGAWLEGRSECATVLERQLATALRKLRQNAAPVLLAAALGVDEAGLSAVAQGEAFEPALMTELVDLLRQQSLAALDRFQLIAPALRRQLGETSYARISGLVDDLKFVEAADALEAGGQQLARPADLGH